MWWPLCGSRGQQHAVDSEIAKQHADSPASSAVLIRSAATESHAHTAARNGKQKPHSVEPSSSVAQSEAESDALSLQSLSTLASLGQQPKRHSTGSARSSYDHMSPLTGALPCHPGGSGSVSASESRPSIDEDDILLAAVLPDKSQESLPVVSLKSLRRAYTRTRHAIAVVRVASSKPLPGDAADLHGGSIDSSGTYSPGPSPVRPGAGPAPEGAPWASAACMGSVHWDTSGRRSGDSNALARRSHDSNAFAVRTTPAVNGFSVASARGAGGAGAASGGVGAGGCAGGGGDERTDKSVHGGNARRTGAPNPPSPGTQRFMSYASSEDAATEQLAYLEPVFLNRPLQRMLDISTMAEYSFIMEKQMLRNPMLVMLFENACRRLLQGKAITVRQYMPYFVTPTSVHPSKECSFISLEITACGFYDEEDGTTTPGLFLWYNAPYNTNELTAQLKRDYITLSHIPSLVTVFGFDGRVLHQNGCSVAYMGFIMDTTHQAEGVSLRDPAHKLRRLFDHEPVALKEMMEVLSEGKTWHAVMRMPSQLDLTEEWDAYSSCDDDDALCQGQALRGTASDRPQSCGASNGTRGTAATACDSLSGDRDAWAFALGGGGGAAAPPRALAAAAAASSPFGGLPRHRVGNCSSFGLGAALPRGPLTQNGLTGSLRGGVGVGAAAAAALGPWGNGGAGASAPLLRHTSAMPTLMSGSAHRCGPAAPEPPACFSDVLPAPLRSVQQSLDLPRNGRRGSLDRRPGRASFDLCRDPASAPIFDGPVNFTFGTAASVARTRKSSQAPSRALLLLEGKLAKQRAAASAQSAIDGTGEVWHEIQASKFQDPVTGQEVIMLIQTDVTSRMAAEQQLRAALDAEQQLLEEIFPRQVLEAVITAAAERQDAAAEADDGDLARNGSASCGAAGDSGRTLRASGAWSAKLAMHHEQVTILFADIVDFTSMCKVVAPVDVMVMLNDLFTRFDELLEVHGVYKVETIGDCYMCAGGLVFTDAQGFKTIRQSQVDPLHAQRVLAFARAMLSAAAGVRMPHTGTPVQLRVGIHSGPVVSGIVGTRMPRFCLFGDTVNTASRMESSSRPGAIHVSGDTHALLAGRSPGRWRATGGVDVRGKGVMDTYLYVDG